MTRKIFYGIFSVSIITLIISLIFVIGVQFQVYENGELDSLKSKANLIDTGLQESDAYLNSLNTTDERITLIDHDGTVLFDNQYDISKMENHSNRKEVKQAMESGEGMSSRFSDTLSKETVYYAKKLKDGRILRVAHTKLTFLAVFIQLLQPISAVTIFAIILSICLAITISKKIVKPINDININNPSLEDSYDELAPFIRKINQQNRKISKQISELTNSKREFEVISKNMSEGLLLTDKEGKILAHNSSIEKFFDTNCELDGKNILTINRSEEFRTVFDNLKNGSHTNLTLSFEDKTYEVTGNPVFDKDGEHCGAVILIVDVTEKESREKLRREFTANVSHELKTPLTSILGISEMLKSGIVKNEDIKSFADDINKETKRLIALVNDIIKLSKLDEGILEKSPSNCDMQSIASEVIERLTPIAAEKNIKLIQTGESAVINADKSLISEMIYNLCDNAIKYNKENGKVTVTTGTLDKQPFVTVADTGIGIEKEYLDRIFERFYRIDSSRSKLSGGTGLGLSIVKHTAACSGGKISIKSEPGVGTEITVTFEKP